MTNQNPVEASTSTPDASTATNPSRGVNGTYATAIGGEKDRPKDAGATRTLLGQPSRVPAPLLAALLTIAWLAIPTYLLLKGPHA